MAVFSQLIDFLSHLRSSDGVFKHVTMDDSIGLFDVYTGAFIF